MTSPLRLGFEANELTDSAPSGVARYVSNLGQALALLTPEISLDWLVKASRWTRRKRISSNGCSRPMWIFPPVWPITGYDIAHLTAGRAVPMPRAKRMVGTVHDLWEFRRLEDGSLTAPTTSMQRLTELLPRMDGVVCVSQSSADDLRRFFPTFTKPVAVTHLGVSHRFRPSTPEKIADACRRHRLPVSEYLIYVGHYHIRKNVERLVEGYALLGHDTPPLILAGNDNPEQRERMATVIRRCGAEGRIRQIGYVHDSDLAPLLSGARGVTFTPLFEGFGLPLIEAYACGTPAVTTGTSSLLELAHASSPLVDPLNPASIRDGIARMLATPLTATLRHEIAHHGASFTWDRCARSTLALYRQTLG